MNGNAKNFPCTSFSKNQVIPSCYGYPHAILLMRFRFQIQPCTKLLIYGYPTHDVYPIESFKSLRCFSLRCIYLPKFEKFESLRCQLGRLDLQLNFRVPFAITQQRLGLSQLVSLYAISSHYALIYVLGYPYHTKRYVCTQKSEMYITQKTVRDMSSQSSIRRVFSHRYALPM